MPYKSAAKEREYQKMYQRMKRAKVPGTPKTAEEDIKKAGVMYERIVKLEKQIEELHTELTLLKQEQHTTDLENSLKDKQG